MVSSYFLFWSPAFVDDIVASALGRARDFDSRKKKFKIQQETSCRK
jgi:hypothetical protein